MYDLIATFGAILLGLVSLDVLTVFLSVLRSGPGEIAYLRRKDYGLRSWVTGALRKPARGATMRELEGIENWTPPAKPDRYVVAWEEAYRAFHSVHNTDIARPHAAAAVLRRHFEPPARVIQAARCLRDGSPKGGSAELCADFILKGDQ